MRRARTFVLAIAFLVGSTPEANAVATQVEATLHLKLGNGTPAVSLLRIEPPDVIIGPFEGTGVAPIVVSGGPGAYVVSLPSGIPITSTGTLLPEPHAIPQPPVVEAFGGHGARHDSLDFGPGVLTLLVGSGSGELPMRGDIVWGRTSGPAIIGPMTLNAGATGFGVGGPLFAHLSSAVKISLQGAPWTIGTASLQSQTASGALFTFMSVGFAHGPLSATTTAVLPGGVLQLVTPLQVQSTSYITPVFTWGLFGELTLRFVPEPSASAMLGLGAAAVAILGWRRTRVRGS